MRLRTSTTMRLRDQQVLYHLFNQGEVLSRSLFFLLLILISLSCVTSSFIPAFNEVNHRAIDLEESSLLSLSHSSARSSNPSSEESQGFLHSFPVNEIHARQTRWSKLSTKRSGNKNRSCIKPRNVRKFDCGRFCKTTGFDGIIGGCRCGYILFTKKDGNQSVLHKTLEESQVSRLSTDFQVDSPEVTTSSSMEREVENKSDIPGLLRSRFHERR